MRLLFVTVILALTLLSYDEPSAFGAGDLNADSPYGLTNSEKHIYDNKLLIKDIDKKLKKQDDLLRKDFFKFRSSIESLGTQIDGIKSVLEGESNSRVKHNKANAKYKATVDALVLEVKKIQVSIVKSNKINQNNIDNIKHILQEISQLIDSINNSYVSMDEFKAFKEEVSQKFKKQDDNKLSNIPNPKLHTQAVNRYKKKDYDQALSRFRLLIKHNYKPAQSHYYIGEIYFYTKQYKRALKNYKKSIKLYSKTSYASTILLHSAESYLALKDTKKAKKTLNVLIKMYPNEKNAKIARKKLKNIK